jgi:hypothetical protein
VDSHNIPAIASISPKSIPILKSLCIFLLPELFSRQTLATRGPSLLALIVADFSAEQQYGRRDCN